MHIDVQAFLESLPILGLGMVGIFIVTAIIIVIVMLLNKTTSGK